MIRIENIKLDEDYYNLLINFLNHETGLNFKYYRRNFIQRRIKARMIRVNCETIESYYYHVKDNPLEIQHFLDCFNINYSNFFRNWDVFLQFENFLLKALNHKREHIFSNLKANPKRNNRRKLKRTPKNIERSKNLSSYRKIMASKSLSALSFVEKTSFYEKINSDLESNKQIKIWSCPCASGEEPYSIAIILDNLKKQILKFPRFKIVASDIDGDAINRAKAGIYNESSMKEVSRFNEKHYFTKIKARLGYKYVISNDIKDCIEFIEEDVTKGHKKSLKYDIIFCRYLLIYISQEARNNFLSIIENQLSPGGLLILGKTETLFNSNNTLKLIDSRNHIYLKEAGF